MMVPNELKLWQFRKYYNPVLEIGEKEIILNMGLDPWSIRGLKYVGDCRHFRVNLEDTIPYDID